MNETTIKLMLGHCAARWSQLEIQDYFGALETTLTPREVKIIRGLHAIGCEAHGYKVLASHFKISIERVEQIRDRAFRKIGHPLRAEIVSKLMTVCGVEIEEMEKEKEIAAIDS